VGATAPLFCRRTTTTIIIIIVVVVVVVVIIIIIIIIETFVTRLLQLKNEHKRYISYGKIDKNR